MIVAYFETETGRIFAEFGTTDLEGFAPLPEGALAILLDGTQSAAKGYIVGGAYQQFPPRPSQAHTWSWTTKTWDLDLTLARKNAWDRIKQARAAALNEPLVTPQGTFQCDPSSQVNIADAALRVKTRHERGLPSDCEFTLADNTRPTFTMEEMVAVALAMGDRKEAIYATAHALRSEIYAAETIEQIESIQWPAA